jgi:hypothetical protein
LAPTERAAIRFRLETDPPASVSLSRNERRPSEKLVRLNENGAAAARTRDSVVKEPTPLVITGRDLKRPNYHDVIELAVFSLMDCHGRKTRLPSRSELPTTDNEALDVTPDLVGPNYR